MTFYHSKSSHHELFLAQEDNEKAGEVAFYQKDEQTLVLDHTLVEDAFQGQQLGQKLVNQVVDYAREKGFKIIPQCPYAARLFQKDSSYADVWQKEEA